VRAALAGLTLALVACDGCASSPKSTPPETGPLSPLSAEQMAALTALSPAELPPAPPDVTNRLADDPDAARFGQTLFFDPGFAGRLLDGDNDGTATALGRVGDTGKVACASCHVPDSGFVDTRSLGQQISLAAGWGLRKPPSLLNVAQDKLLLWDGGRDSLYGQVFGPMESPLEMNSSRLFIAEELARRYRADYEALFGTMPAFDDPAAFPQIAADVSGCTPHGGIKPVCTGTLHGVPGDGAEYDGLSAEDQYQVTLAVVNMGKAIAAFERKLTCGQSRFDQWMHGEADALNDQEIRGAGLFVGKAECVNCHSGPFFSDQSFHNVGLKPVTINFAAPADAGDRGALDGVTKALAEATNSQGVYSDGYDGRLPADVPSTWLAAFKTPMLRCVERSPSFMHTAQLKSLQQVVQFFDAGSGRPEFGTNELHPLGLTEDEEGDLVAFLLALTGPGPDAALLAP
jgi:cytochrome c peroxidase